MSSQTVDSTQAGDSRAVQTLEGAQNLLFNKKREVLSLGKYFYGEQAAHE